MHADETALRLSMRHTQRVFLLKDPLWSFICFDPTYNVASLTQRASIQLRLGFWQGLPAYGGF